MKTPRALPANRTSRAQRVQRLEEVLRQGARQRPVPLTENNARYLWQKLVRRKNRAIPPHSRLVAFCLSSYGRADGSDIYPSIRTLATDSGLSTRVVCLHIDHLIRMGFLLKQAHGNGVAGASGYIYTLCVPEVLATDTDPIWLTESGWRPKLRRKRADAPSAPSVHAASTPSPAQPVDVASTPSALQGVHATSTPNPDNPDRVTPRNGPEGVHAGAKGVHVDDTKVCTLPPEGVHVVVQRCARHVHKDSESSDLESYAESLTVVSGKPDRTGPRGGLARGRKGSPSPEENRDAILKLLREGNGPADVVKLLGPRGITIEDVEQVQGGA